MGLFGVKQVHKGRGVKGVHQGFIHGWVADCSTERVAVTNSTRCGKLLMILLAEAG